MIISGGGTGGHVYPALAVVAELKQQPEPPEIRWVGSVGGMEQALVERADLTFESIAASGLRGKNPTAVLQGVWTLGQGYLQSRRIIRRFQPDVLFVTGGYVCAPVTLAARQAGTPVIIYLPDIEPGLAIKFLARLAKRVAVTAEESRQFFKPGLTVVTGYPVRAELVKCSSGDSDAAVKAEARRQLGLRADLPVLLVFGGSRGARSINRAVAGDIEALLAVSQVIHVSGSLDEAWVKARRSDLPAALQARYQVSAYLHEEMIAALQAADLAVSRAGASILGEFPAAGLPAILAPYPYAGAHQALNAAYLAKQGAALVIEDAELDGRLKDTVLELITDQNKLRAMQTASSTLAKPQAASRLAQEILEVGAHGN
jgi:UDP-N-acetylglucosamine--N-acetylmuramyl-(pentapeptide) pyrophosphoryl-undecaprenol N-acetylglucosamine transferase